MLRATPNVRLGCPPLTPSSTTPHPELEFPLALLTVVFGPIPISLFLGGMAFHALDALDLATAVAGLWLALPPVVVKEGVPTELFVADRTRKYLGVGRGVRQLLVGKEGALAAIAVE